MAALSLIARRKRLAAVEIDRECPANIIDALTALPVGS